MQRVAARDHRYCFGTPQPRPRPDREREDCRCRHQQWLGQKPAQRAIRGMHGRTAPVGLVFEMNVRCRGGAGRLDVPIGQLHDRRLHQLQQGEADPEETDHGRGAPHDREPREIGSRWQSPLLHAGTTRWIVGASQARPESVYCMRILFPGRQPAFRGDGVRGEPPCLMSGRSNGPPGSPPGPRGGRRDM
jgi:hypothetical protein